MHIGAYSLGYVMISLKNKYEYFKQPKLDHDIQTVLFVRTYLHLRKAYN